MKHWILLLNYFSQGFTLANKSFEVYLVTLILIVMSSINAFIPKPPWPEAISTVYFIISTLLYFGFSLSTPVFLREKQHGKALNFRTVFLTTLQNTKRILLPGIVLFIIMIALGIFSMFIIYTSNNKEQIIQSLRSIGTLNGRDPISLISFALTSFFVFTSFFFSLDNKNLLISIKNSIVTSFKHLSYILIIAVISIISTILVSFIPLDKPWLIFLKDSISSYIGFIIIASTLSYYQKVIKKETA